MSTGRTPWAAAWDEALAADRPVVLEVKTDPEVPPLPPHITLRAGQHLTTTLIKGDPRRRQHHQGDARSRFLASHRSRRSELMRHAIAGRRRRSQRFDGRGLSHTDRRPEADGTFAWNATTLVVVHIEAAGASGIGYTYADASSSPLIRARSGPAHHGARCA